MSTHSFIERLTSVHSPVRGRREERRNISSLVYRRNGSRHDSEVCETLAEQRPRGNVPIAGMRLRETG